MEIVPRGYVAALEIQSTWMDKIREAQKTDKEIASIKEKLSKGKAKGFREDEHDTLWFEDRVYVPNDLEIRKLILQARVQYSFSSADRWPDRESQSDFGGYVESLCARLWI